MKKTIFRILPLFVVGVFFGNTSFASTNVKASTIISITDETKTPVKLEDLPAGVKTTLASDEYKTWTATQAFLVKEEGNEYYEIEMKQEDKKTTVNLDKEGKKVETKTN